MYFSWDTSFPYVQINAFMAAANVFYRQYSVLPISQPTEVSVQGGIMDWSCTQVVAGFKNNILYDSQIGNSYMIN